MSRSTRDNDTSTINEEDDFRSEPDDTRPAGAAAAAAACAAAGTRRRGRYDDPPDELLDDIRRVGQDAPQNAVQRMLEAMQRQLDLQPKKTVRMSRYTPTQDIRVWLKAFDQRCDTEEIYSDHDRKAQLFSNLDLNTAYAAVLRMRLPDDLSYRQLKARLIERFSRLSAPDEYREEFRGRMQRKNEELESYTDALQELGEQAFPLLDHIQLEQELIDQFLRGIRTTPDIREKLFCIRPATLSEATRALKRMELAKDLANRAKDHPVRMLEGEEPSTPRTDARLQQLEKLVRQQTDAMEKHSRLLDNLLQRTEAAREPPSYAMMTPRRTPPFVCYECGNPGHRYTDCPQRSPYGYRPPVSGNVTPERVNGTVPRVSAQDMRQTPSSARSPRTAQQPLPSRRTARQ